MHLAPYHSHTGKGLDMYNTCVTSCRHDTTWNSKFQRAVLESLKQSTAWKTGCEELNWWFHLVLLIFILTGFSLKLPTLRAHWLLNPAYVILMESFFTLIGKGGFWQIFKGIFHHLLIAVKLLNKVCTWLWLYWAKYWCTCMVWHTCIGQSSGLWAGCERTSPQRGTLSTSACHSLAPVHLQFHYWQYTLLLGLRTTQLLQWNNQNWKAWQQGYWRWIFFDSVSSIPTSFN